MDHTKIILFIAKLKPDYNDCYDKCYMICDGYIPIAFHFLGYIRKAQILQTLACESHHDVGQYS